jgi:hypothetical protein
VYAGAMYHTKRCTDCTDWASTNQVVAVDQGSSLGDCADWHQGVAQRRLDVSHVCIRGRQFLEGVLGQSDRK